MTQWTQGSAPGASGSSQMSTSSLVPSGKPLQLSGGERSQGLRDEVARSWGGDPAPYAAKQIETASAALAAENRRIEAELTAEEKALTDKRPAMPAEEFRKLADDFDARVTEFRQTQDGKARFIGRIHDAERQAFFAAALPVMAEVLRGHGAVAVLDSRAIFLSADAIDATEEMIARIDAEIGEGKDVEIPAEAEDAGGAAGAPGAVAPAPGTPSGN